MHLEPAQLLLLAHYIARNARSVVEVRRFERAVRADGVAEPSPTLSHSDSHFRPRELFGRSIGAASGRNKAHHVPLGGSARGSCICHVVIDAAPCLPIQLKRLERPFPKRPLFASVVNSVGFCGEGTPVVSLLAHGTMCKFRPVHDLLAANKQKVHVAMIMKTGRPHHDPIGFEDRDDVEAETTKAGYDVGGETRPHCIPWAPSIMIHASLSQLSGTGTARNRIPCDG